MFRSVITLVTVSVAVLVLSSCNAVPVVQYNKIETPADAKGVTDSFYLAQSQITIDKIAESEDKAKNKKTDEYSITSRPVAHETYKIGIRPGKSFTVTTKVNIVKTDNTDLVSSMGIETTDNTASLITSVGGALTKVIGLLAVLAPRPGAQQPCIGVDNYPVRFTVTAALLAGASSTKSIAFNPDGKEDPNGCIGLTLGDYPKDAILDTELPYKVSTSNFYYSACRDAVVTFKNEKSVSKRLRIADPNRLQFVELPYKGSVSMHSECGVSVKTEGTSPQNTAIGIVDALAAQGKAIKEAIDAAKK